MTAVLLATASACEPVHTTDLYVDLLDAGNVDPDAAPGDGVCETEPGNGSCSLTAAVEEANALGRATIHLPGSSNYFYISDVVITGSVSIRQMGSPDQKAAISSSSSPSTLEVASGARLDLTDILLMSSEPTVVEGVLTARRSILGGLDVAPTGSVLILNTILDSYGEYATIRNRGRFHARFSQLNPSPVGLIETSGDGVSTLGAVTTMSPTGAEPTSECIGTQPVSEGYNLLKGCGLDGPGDHNAGHDHPDNTVPLGVLDCGVTVVDDILGMPRPAPGTDQCVRGAGF